MHENNPLHTFTTAVHVSVVAFAMNARYPGQFPNCSERQTRRMKERELDDRRATRTANLIERERQREMAKARERWKREKEREKAILSYASSAPETHRISLSLSLHSTFIFLLLDQHPLPPSPRYLFSLSRRVQPLRTARTPPRANTGQRLLRVSPSPLDLHDLHESPPGSNCL